MYHKPIVISKMFRSVILLVLCMFKVTHSFSDVGKWILPLSGETCEFQLMKSLFKDSKLIVVFHCDVAEPTNITVQYTWSTWPCSPDYFHYFEKPPNFSYKWTEICTDYVPLFLKCGLSRTNEFRVPETMRKHFCGGQTVFLCDVVKLKNVKCSNRVKRSVNNSTAIVHVLKKETTFQCKDKDTIFFFDDKTSTSADDGKKTEGANKDENKKTLANKPMAVVEKEGVYLFTMEVRSTQKFKATVRVEMVAPSGYLSAATWPLLPMFGTMCGLYAILCTSWLIVCALQWRDLLRIQYWIGGVALLGMIESSVYYGVYSTINSTGLFNADAYIVAEWVSVAKRALARMLVIIVSLGFGIVKPRLGPALQRVVGVGVLWGALACLEAWLRLHHKDDNSNRDLLLSEAPLSLLDSAICWWVFVSLSSTLRTLALRRNMIKLSLYKHFTHTVIFAVISSVVFMLYSIKSFRTADCITNWKEVWVDEAYWHILFASVLAAIMVLWRPTNNNQRYAFTPLLDNAEDDEDDEEEQFVNDAYGVKMRGSTNTSAEAVEAKEKAQDANTLESDLRWVEENIPTSSLPLLDSDEELLNTKFEVSKMQ